MIILGLVLQIAMSLVMASTAPSTSSTATTAAAATKYNPYKCPCDIGHKCW